MKLDRVALLGMVALSAISTDLYLSGIPQIVSEFSATEADGQLTLSIFIIGICVGQIFYGPLSDVYGRKPVLYAGLSAYILATLACAISASMEQLLVVRFFQAVAAASGPVLARAIVTDLYESHEAAKIMALLTAAMALLPMVAPIVGSWMLYVFDWRSQFYLLIVVGSIILICSRSLPESFPREPDRKFSFAQIGHQFAASLKQPAFVGYALIGGSGYGALFCWISVAPFVVINQFSVPEEAFGYTFAVVVLGYSLGAYTSSRLVTRFGLHSLIRAGVILGTFFVLAILLISIGSLQSLVILLLMVFGVFYATGLSLSNTQVAAISAFPKSAGQASSVFGFLQYALAAIAGTSVGQLYNGTLMPLALAFCFLMVVSWVSLVFVIPREGRSRHCES